MAEENLRVGKPLVVHDNDDCIVTFPTHEGYIAFRFDSPIHSKNDVESSLCTSVTLAGIEERNFEARINARSLSSRDSYARQLSKAFGKELPWVVMLSNACKEMMDAHKQMAMDSLLSCDKIETSPTEFLVDGLLQKDSPNVFFGKGGSGKTYLSLRLAMSVASGEPFLGLTPKESSNTMFIDYENTASTFKWRVQKLAKYCTGFNHYGKLTYLPTKGAPLHELKDIVKRMIVKNKIGLVIVDSVALACGGAPEDAQNAIKYFNTLNSWGVTTLSIAHQSKSDTGNNIFGSVFFQNSARNVWNVQNQQDVDDDENVIHAAVMHRKCNDSKLQAPKGVRIYFDEDGVDINFESAFRFSTELGLKTRIINFLKEGDKTIEELKEEFGDKDVAQLKNRLSDLKKKGKIDNPDKGTWQLISGDRKTVEPREDVITRMEEMPW